jgi:hypothetical protein
LRAPIFRGKVEKGRIVLDNKDRFRPYLASFEGKRIELVLKERQAVGPDNPRGFYFGVVIPILTEANIGYEEYEWHEVLKKQFKVKSVSPDKMPNKEFWEYIDKIRRWAAQFHGVKIPEPNEVDY